MLWYIDGSKTDSRTGSGVHVIRPRMNLTFPLGKYATVFQTEIYTIIIQCILENIIRAYSRKQILMFSESETALMALRSHIVTSGLVLNCLNALSNLVEWNEVKLTGHRGIPSHHMLLCCLGSQKILYLWER